MNKLLGEQISPTPYAKIWTLLTAGGIERETAAAALRIRGKWIHTKVLIELLIDVNFANWATMRHSFLSKILKLYSFKGERTIKVSLFPLPRLNLRACSAKRAYSLTS